MQAQRNVSGPIRQQEQQVSQHSVSLHTRCHNEGHTSNVTPCVIFFFPKIIFILIWCQCAIRELLHNDLRKPDGIFMGTSYFLFNKSLLQTSPNSKSRMSVFFFLKTACHKKPVERNMFCFFLYSSQGNYFLIPVFNNRIAPNLWERRGTYFDTVPEVQAMLAWK